MSDKTPTERVRDLLDELGIEHEDNDMNYDKERNYGVRITRWSNGGKRLVSYNEWANGTTRLDAGNVTPEQAIAATVGAHSLNNPKVSEKASERTCQFKVVIDQDPSPRHRGNICECNKCGYRCARGFIVDERFKCCPNCGRRIKVSDATQAIH